jgi:hypothetical protein
MARLVSKYMAPFAARMSSKYAERLNTSVILLHKTRESGSETRVTHLVGDVRGRPCLIVDDMIFQGRHDCRGCRRPPAGGSAARYLRGGDSRRSARGRSGEADGRGDGRSPRYRHDRAPGSRLATPSRGLGGATDCGCRSWRDAKSRGWRPTVNLSGLPRRSSQRLSRAEAGARRVPPRAARLLSHGPRSEGPHSLLKVLRPRPRQAV